MSHVLKGETVNKFDVEFWNGVLKGKNENIIILEKLAEKMLKEQADILRIGIRAIKETERETQFLQIKDLRITRRTAIAGDSGLADEFSGPV